jgi:hypothetical protein
MATAPQRIQREVIDFPANIPITVALKYAQGKIVSSQYGERVMFSLTDGRIMFLDPPVAAQIEALEINVRESFTITKQSDGRKDSPVAWNVARLAGEQPNGTLVVPKLPEAIAPPKPPMVAAHAVPSLAEEANALVDCYAEVLHRALTKHEGRVKPDEVKSILLSAYIQRQKSAA